MQTTTQQKLGALGVTAIAAVGIVWWNTTGQGAKVTRYDVAKFLLSSIAIATAIEVGTTLYKKHRKQRRESEVLELLGVKPKSGRKRLTSVSRIEAIDNSPICRNCCAYWNGGCSSGYDKPTEDGFDCMGFFPREAACPRACTYKQADPSRAQNAVQECLKKPIVVRLSQNYQGVRGVDIDLPWAESHECYVSFGEAPGYAQPTSNGLWTTYAIANDWWNIGPEEASIFAWAVSLSAAITQSRESFEEFWSNPREWVAKFPTPNGHAVEVGDFTLSQQPWRFQSCDN